MTKNTFANQLRKTPYGAVVLADTELDSPPCTLCKKLATEFYITTERGGFYGEYSANFILMLCDSCHDRCCNSKDGGSMPGKKITLNELRVMKVMNE